VTSAVKWSNFFLCRKGKALCKRSFALHRQQSEKYKQNVDVSGKIPPGKITADAHRKGAWGHSNERLPITSERRFSKLRLIKTFHKSTMTNERLANLAVISIERETAKI